jgi:hypothetical protein
MKSLLTLIATIIFFCSSSVIAVAGQIWQGQGEIVRGTGQGGSLGLKIDVEGNTVRFLSGPDRNKQVKVSNLNGSVKISQNTWHFQMQNGNLTITLYQQQPYRVILYRLSSQ